MDFSLDQRTASLSVGELAAFAIGPQDAGEGSQGIWRAQLGTRWHQELRRQVAEQVPAATFEVSVTGQIFHGGWTLTLTGRIDQAVPGADGIEMLREIKTISREVPCPEDALRAEYPDYFAQLAAYLALHRLATPGAKVRGELLFVEMGSGLAQPVSLSRTDETLFTARLERVVEFLNLRLRARERLQKLAFRPAFSTLREGQEGTVADLTEALARSSVVAFEAPTGFGKTGVLLETALAQLRAGRFSRLVYLTSKATGQLQVVRTLEGMTRRDDGTAGVAIWHVRNKAEHCVNHTFHCSRDTCAYLQDLEARWPRSGLSKFYLFEAEARDLPTLKAAGKNAGVCPYEITRAALAFNDVWVGDYNYVFAPRNRRLFYDQPGFDPRQTLLVLDEAHNLPSRVADAYSHVVKDADVRAVLAELDHAGTSTALLRAWETYALLVASLPACDALGLAQEEDLAEVLKCIASLLQQTPVDPTKLAPDILDSLWMTLDLAAWLDDGSLRRLLWCPRAGEVHFTCIDAAPAIGETLRTYGGVILASATIGHAVDFAEAIDLSAAGAASPADLTGPHLETVTARTPWRTGAYDIAYDVRVDTTYQQRERHHDTTAATIEALHAAAQQAGGAGTNHAVAVFFPSYRYAEAIAQALDRRRSVLRVALQPKLPDLAAQQAWVEESVGFSDALFLVLGSSFAEGVDLLGGRISHAMVVGPALPEVNAVQRARLAAADSKGRDAAFRHVYLVPGLQKVNQALGRLVRAPGQHAKVLLHCRRFIEPAYARLLASDYQFGETIADEPGLQSWLKPRS